MSRPIRVAGTDPGTGSLDLVVLEDGEVRAQTRFLPQELAANPTAPVRWLETLGPFDLVAAPSGYGLPLVRGDRCTQLQRDLISLVRPDERRGQGSEAGELGVSGFSAVVEAFCASSLPVIFLPGVIHLPTVPPHRKINRIDLGTPDKLGVATLALAEHSAGWSGNPRENQSCCVVELGSAFTACLVIDKGKVVDGLGGTSGPLGWMSGGGWDGEVAYLMSPLTKNDLFRGGATSITEGDWARELFREAIVRALFGWLAFVPYESIFLSGRLLQIHPDLVAQLVADIESRITGIQVAPLSGLPGAWVKHAAQGSAVLADGLAGGRWADLVERMEIRGSAGTVLDWLRHPRADEVRKMFGG